MNRKFLLVAACAALMTFSVPAMAANMVMEMGVAEQVEEQAPTISMGDNNVVSVQNAAGLTLEVVSLTGVSNKHLCRVSHLCVSIS